MELSLFEDPDLSCPDIPFLEPPVILPSMNDFNTLSSQQDQLGVDINTQNMRCKLEKTKRQRLNSTIKISSVRSQCCLKLSPKPKPISLF